jgi:hypothetical protein
MQYIRVRWNHDRSDEPVELWSELDAGSWEVRKVEVFPDGRLGFASRDESTEDTELGLAPVPAFEEIARDPEFSPEPITQAQFEDVWDLARRMSGVGHSG